MAPTATDDDPQRHATSPSAETTTPVRSAHAIPPGTFASAANETWEGPPVDTQCPVGARSAPVASSQ